MSAADPRRGDVVLDDTGNLFAFHPTHGWRGLISNQASARGDSAPTPPLTLLLRDQQPIRSDASELQAIVDAYDWRMVPTPEQHRAHYLLAGRDRQLRMAELAINSHRRASRCFEMNHDALPDRIAHLQEELARVHHARQVANAFEVPLHLVDHTAPAPPPTGRSLRHWLRHPSPRLHRSRGCRRCGAKLTRIGIPS